MNKLSRMKLEFERSQAVAREKQAALKQATDSHKRLLTSVIGEVILLSLAKQPEALAKVASVVDVNVITPARCERLRELLGLDMMSGHSLFEAAEQAGIYKLPKSNA